MRWNGSSKRSNDEKHASEIKADGKFVSVGFFDERCRRGEKEKKK